jgi:hypothetical protein
MNEETMRAHVRAMKGRTIDQIRDISWKITPSLVVQFQSTISGSSFSISSALAEAMTPPKIQELFFQDQYWANKNSKKEFEVEQPFSE